jgi:hypothetical protein
MSKYCADKVAPQLEEMLPFGLFNIFKEVLKYSGIDGIPVC